MISDLYMQNLDSYAEHLNIHIYKMLHAGAAKLPSFNRYYFPEVLTSEWYSAILRHSELFRILQYVFSVQVDMTEGCVIYAFPLTDKYDKALITIAKYSEKSDQISRVLQTVKEESNEVKKVI